MNKISVGLRTANSCMLLICFIFSINFRAFSQDSSSSSIDNRKDYLSFNILPHWNTVRVSNIQGEVDKVRASVLSGFVFDVAYRIEFNQLSFESSLGHGFYNEGIYYEFDDISNPDFSYYSDKSFEKNRALQYSSFKFICAKKSSHFKAIEFRLGMDIRMNWGHMIRKNGSNRNDISFGGLQEINGIGSNEYTQLYFFDSRLKRNLSINPILGLDYVYEFKGKQKLHLGLVYSVPFLNILKSEVLLYPEYPDLNSSFEMNYFGGFVGIKLAYSIPL